MVVAVVRNFLFLLLIFITIGQKGLFNAKICSKSAETVSPVQKCPANQKEWEDAAQRKNCSEIQNYDNCTNVEYHCLVNEFRNETIEVCTERRILKKGYCPIYSQNKATTDWRNYCGNQTSCNCSSIGYNSTKAYKWQCCYNGTNINSQGMQNDQDKFLPNKTHRGDSVKDQSNNVYVEVWLIPLLLIIAALAVLVFCVCYGMKRQNKTFFEDLKKKDMADEVERTLLQKTERHIPLAGTTEVDGSKPDIQEPPTPDGDSSYQGMSTSITQEDIMSLNSGTHDLLNTSSEKEVAKSLTSASPNEDSSKQGRPASDVQNKIETQPVLETSAKKDSKSLTPASLNGDSSNQRMSASVTLDEIKTPPVLDTSVKDVSKSLTPASLNKDSSKQGMPASDAQDKIETPPVLETLAKKDSKLSTPESPNRDSLNQGMSASNIPEKIVTPVLEMSAKEDSKSSTSESPNRDSSNLGVPASDTLEKIVTPVLETSAKEDSKSSTSESPNKESSNLRMSASDTLEKIITPVLETSAKEDLKPSTSESPNKDSSNLGMSTSDIPNENSPKPKTSASKTTGGDISKSEIPETVLSERVAKMQEEMNKLKGLIDIIYGKGVWDLDYKLKCADLNIITMRKTMFEDVECVDTAALKTKATEVENKLHQLLQKQGGIGKGLDKMDGKLLHPVHNNQVEDKHEPEEEANESSAASNVMETVENRTDEDWQFPDDKKYKKDDEEHKRKAENLAYQKQLLESYMKKKKRDDSVLLEVFDTNGASSNHSKSIKDDKKELASEEKRYIKKLDDLMIRTKKLLKDVENLRKNVDKFLSLGLLDATGERLKEIDAYIDILSESYHLSDLHPRRSNTSRVKKLAELNKLYENVKKKYDELKSEVG